MFSCRYSEFHALCRSSGNSDDRQSAWNSEKWQLDICLYLCHFRSTCNGIERSTYSSHLCSFSVTFCWIYIYIYICTSTQQIHTKTNSEFERNTSTRTERQMQILWIKTSLQTQEKQTSSWKRESGGKNACLVMSTSSALTVILS